MQLHGIHHLTAVIGRRARQPRFYTRTLGMRLVKKTVNQDDVCAYHLFYADGAGHARHRPDLLRLAGRARAARHPSIVRTGAAGGGPKTLCDWWIDAPRRGAACRTARSASGTGGSSSTSRIRRASAYAGRRWRRRAGPSLGPQPGAARASRSAASARSRSACPTLRPTDLVLTAGDGDAAGAQLRGAGRRGRHASTSTRWARAARRRNCTSGSSRTCRARSQGAGGVHHVAFRVRDEEYDRLGRAAAAAAHPVQRAGGPLLLPQPLLPRAERHPLRDRHRRPGLRHRRAAREPRRAAGAAALPGAAARGDRGAA